MNSSTASSSTVTRADISTVLYEFQVDSKKRISLVVASSDYFLRWVCWEQLIAASTRRAVRSHREADALAGTSRTTTGTNTKRSSAPQKISGYPSSASSQSLPLS